MLILRATHIYRTRKKEMTDSNEIPGMWLNYGKTQGSNRMGKWLLVIFVSNTVTCNAGLMILTGVLTLFVHKNNNIYHT